MRVLLPSIALTLCACAAETSSPAVIARFEVLQGEGVTAAPRERPDSAIILRLLDDQDHPVSGVAVRYSAITADVTFDSVPSETGPDGLLVFYPRAGRRPGTQSIQVSTDGGVFARVNFQAQGMEAKRVVAGGGFACAIDHAEQAWCWGAPAGGALGDSGAATRRGGHAVHPTKVVGGLQWVDLAAGYEFACGIATDGGTRCWGRATQGQLGRGTLGGDATCPVAAGCSSVPRPIAGDPGLVSLVASTSAACGLTSSGQAYCWGSLRSPYSGTVWPAPTAIGGAVRFTQLVAGYADVCGISTTDQVWCWGSNGQGELGVPSIATAGTDTAVFVSSLPAGSRLQGDDDMTCWLTPTEQATCWGRMKTDGLIRTAPTRLPALDGTRALGALWFALVALDPYRTFRSWDYWNKRWTDVGAPFEQLVQIDAGANNGCGRTQDDLVVCWGENSSGELGNEELYGWSDAYVWPPRFVLPPRE